MSRQGMEEKYHFVFLTLLHDTVQKCTLSQYAPGPGVIAGSLEAAYSLNWGAREIWGKGGGETLALL